MMPDGSKVTMGLSALAKLVCGWPTPTVTDASRGVKEARPWDTGKPLGQIVALAGWPTPQTLAPAKAGYSESGSSDYTRKVDVACGMRDAGVSEWPAQVVDMAASTGPTNGFWRAADWLLCRDGKWRPVEPGTFPLAHGAPARVGRLRAFGNCINAIQAEEFIRAYNDGTVT